jgi:hypothetical protein
MDDMQQLYSYPTRQMKFHATTPFLRVYSMTKQMTLATAFPWNNR